MLSLEDALLGFPSSPALVLRMPVSSAVIYATGETIVLLDASTLRLLRTLTLKEAFPAAHNVPITVLDVENHARYVLGVSQTHVAVWEFSDSLSSRVHSAFTNSEPVTCAHIKRDHIAIGHSGGVALKRLETSREVPIWITLWTQPAPTPHCVSLSPSLTFVASASNANRSVHVLSVKSPNKTQVIKHPHPVLGLQWREPRGRYSEERCLYTFTSDSVLRVFAPVIDVPNRLQLQAALDRWCFTDDDGYGYGDTEEQSLSQSGTRDVPFIFPLDRDVLCRVLPPMGAEPMVAEEEKGGLRKLKELAEDDWELFGFVSLDGTLTVKALINLDKRPPTLLQNFTMLKIRDRALDPSQQLFLAPSPDPSRALLLSSFPLRSYELLPLPFVDGEKGSMRRIACGRKATAKSTRPVVGFVRTPDGSAIASRRGGGGEIYLRDRKGRLAPTGAWDDEGTIALFDGGSSIAIYHNSVLTVHIFSKGSTNIQETLTIDYTAPSEPSLITLPSHSSITPILSITPTLIATFHLHKGITSSLWLHSITSLPLPSHPNFILPVDPMAWAHELPTGHSVSLSSPELSPTIPLAPSLADSETDHKHDALVSVMDGSLAFWTPDREDPSGWRCTGSVNTYRKQIRMARCSSAKKTAIISVESSSETLTIWDSKESEFSSGLEFSQTFGEAVNDLDWTSTDSQEAHSILAVGFSQRVVLLGQQRMTYFDQEPWRIIAEIDIRQYTSYPIKDSIWFAGGSLVIGAGHQVLQYGSTIGAMGDSADKPLSLFAQVARQNGPLPDYHPQNLLQCLLWDKLELVERILVMLAAALEASRAPGGTFVWSQFCVSEYTDPSTKHGAVTQKKSQHSYLFSNEVEESDNSVTTFGPALVSKLISRLKESPLPDLSPNEMAHLTVLIQTTLEVEQQKRSLDANGLRYLLSMRSFYIINSGHVNTNTGKSVQFNLRTIGVRQRIRYRDILWAYLSESQEILLDASTTADARALGVFLWLNSTETIKSQAEVVARNQYMAGENRDPTSCCLFYFALRKVKLVHGLWKRATWHPEQQLMLKFLSNDFDNPRWRTAALKNAFALISKQRYEYAAAFFLLGRSLQDAVAICIKQLQDFQLAVALARIVEDGDDGPVLKDILANTVLPIALKEGNRWLACWAFWILKRRDLSLRVLLTPLENIAASFDITVAEIGNPHYDDPSLALLFLQLKHKSLQTAKGFSEISGRTEFNFVLQMARVFCRMGCHSLALELVSHWQFTHIRPPKNSMETASKDRIADEASRNRPSSSPSVTRHPLGGSLRARRSSILIDMEIPSLPATRPTSPGPAPLRAVPEHLVPQSPHRDGSEADIEAKRTGLGSLMRSARKDVTIPEFDMNAFF
ncbi:RAVE protein 1 C terminal-domain-containing protein [Cantharellus anzutake]|uniref:RAVE protein 1 C terminal-domain-containing protein n=1 Tax=Cantharellus anzutake TaxID=1750568 RepID=UPI001904058E|nr:RAVE protein 1 C terminal-domain-containing protein [Cantharellus anzutake]KAF8320625.1 RAVE protein 1 C terminal-domain-containing protein [Cantharellus anzutake]